MREGLVGFSHTMDFIALLNGTAAVFSGVEQFAGEAAASTFRNGP